MFVQKDILKVIALSIVAIILLVLGIYFLTVYNVNSMNSMMGGVSSPSALIVSLILIGAAVTSSVGAILAFIYRKERIGSAVPKTTEIKAMKNVVPVTPSIRHSRSSRPFDVFLCYKKSSGKDFADHLKAGLEELGLHTFEDCKDIPQTVNTDEGWACDRDKALAESKYFVLIMTPGFELSSEAVKEIAMARKQPNKTFVFFRHRSMPRNIQINFGSEILDVGKLEQVSFESKEELLRLANDILLHHKS